MTAQASTPDVVARPLIAAPRVPLIPGAPVATLSDLQRNSARMLAALIDTNKLAGATPDARFLLRSLAMHLLVYADETAALEERLRPRSPRELDIVRLRPALAVIDGGKLTAASRGVAASAD